jgi:ferredoxin
MQQWLSLKASSLARFLRNLSRDHGVFAPLRLNGSTSFKPIAFLDEGYELDVDRIPTHYSAKKFFLPPKEALFDWELLPHKVEVKPSLPSLAELESRPKKIIFGIRGCDVAAVDFMNQFFGQKYADPYYANNAARTAKITLACPRESKYCFCRTYGTWTRVKDADVVMVPASRSTFTLRASTRLGEEILSKNKGLLKTASGAEVKRAEKMLQEGPKENGSRLLPIEKLQAFLALDEHKMLESKEWVKVGEKCFACAACTLVCPTCSCFDSVEEPNLDFRSGTRNRVWDSCMLMDFTRMAGDYYARRDITARLRWRILHKLRYPTERFGLNGCVGCGRCIEICLADIDHRKVATGVLKERLKQQAEQAKKQGKGKTER